MSVWCRQLVIEGNTRSRVRITDGATGVVDRIENDVDPQVGDIVFDLAIPGIANAHSHAFHRLLRGRTHGHGGDFWEWRDQMYRVAEALDPARYYALASAVFAEMLTAGFTAVGEFHYVHHKPGGEPYPHEMEFALAAAASDTGIRLTLLDTIYLAGGVGIPLQPEQLRFGDGTVDAYLNRWYELAQHVPHLGAGLHSARAVPPDAIRAVRDGLPQDVPLHIHLSEQPQENVAVQAEYGVTPTRLLFDSGVLSPRLSAVHATHLTDEDIQLLGEAGTTVIMCPTTEADLGDGIGPARELLDAGATLALGSDQNAVIDPMLEIRGLEMQDRLRSRRRGRFTLPELSRAAGVNGYRSLGLPPPLQPGGSFDLVEIDRGSVRTIGADPAQILLTATASDVKTVIVGGKIVASGGSLADGRRPADMLTTVLEEMQ